MFKQYEMPLLCLCTMQPIFGNQFLRDLVMEVSGRLRQLDWFLQGAWNHVHRCMAMNRSIKQLRDEEGLINAVTSQQFNAEMSQMAIEMDMASDAAEAFYLFGFRVFDITRTVNKRCCSSRLRVCEPSNFMSVRNHLIIHPEVLSWSACVTNADNRGVVLKNKRSATEEQGYVDPGLGPNSIELQRYLEEWIIALTKKLNARQSESGHALSQPS